MTVEKLEERWTLTTVQTAFAFPSLPSKPHSGGITIDLPLPNLGWTFSLLLTPDPERRARKGLKSVQRCNWIPTAFSFRQQGSAILWGNTSIHAQLLPVLAVDQHVCGSPAARAEVCAPPIDMSNNSTLLGTMKVALAQTTSLEVPLSTACALLKFNKLWLTVTISDCPLANGLFRACSGPVNEAEVQGQLVRRSGDRLLSRSLATGKLFDVKFLTSTRLNSTSGNTGRLLPTYASLSVLEEHVKISSCE